MLSLVIAAFVGSGALTYAATASLSFTTTIEGGSLVESASYVVFKDGSTYFAKNGTTGAIDYSGTNASEIINNVITVLYGTTSGGSILLKAGRYVIDSEIQIPAVDKFEESFALSIQGEILSGEAYYTKLLDIVPEGTILEAANGYTGHIIFVGYNASSGYHAKNVVISHLTISGHELPYLSSGHASITMAVGKAGLRALNVINAHFHHLTFINCYYGIYMTTNAGNNDGVQISHIWAGYNRYGILVGGASHSVFIRHIYTYLNYGTAIHLAGSGIVSLSDVYSNADAWELLSVFNSSIQIYGNGFTTLENIVIYSGKSGDWAGIRGLYLSIAKINATILVDNIMIQGVNGTAVYVKESNIQGFISLNRIYASPNASSTVGGEGRNNGYGVQSMLQNTTGTQLYLQNSVLYNNVLGAYSGNFTRVDNVLP